MNFAKTSFRNSVSTGNSILDASGQIGDSILDASDRAQTWLQIHQKEANSLNTKSKHLLRLTA